MNDIELHYAQNPQEAWQEDLGGSLDKVVSAEALPAKRNYYAQTIRMVRKGYSAFAQRQGWEDEHVVRPWCLRQVKTLPAHLLK